MKLDMKENKFTGKLITFCGVDGCGKTTQIKRLINYFEQRKRRVFITKQPTDFVRKSKIFRTFLDTPEHDGFDYRALSLMAASDRIQHTNGIIAKHLSEGDIVISDRYYYSCLANLKARGYAKDCWIYEIAKFIIKPDIAFFLDSDIKTAIKRVRARENEKNRYIDIGLQYKLRDEYKKISGENDGFIIPTTIPEDESFTTISYIVSNILQI